MSMENKTIRPEKEAMYQEVREAITQSEYLLVVDSKGLTAVETAAAKEKLKDVQARLRVVKNRMLQRIQRDAGLELPLFPGPTAVVTGTGDAVETAKILKAIGAGRGTLQPKGGVLNNTVLSADDVVELAKLPGRKELQAKLVGTLAAPMTQVVGVMNQKVCSLLYVLNAVREKKEQAA